MSDLDEFDRGVAAALRTLLEVTRARADELRQHDDPIGAMLEVLDGLAEDVTEGRLQATVEAQEARERGTV